MTESTGPPAAGDPDRYPSPTEGDDMAAAHAASSPAVTWLVSAGSYEEDHLGGGSGLLWRVKHFL